ncbi:hypothetical protein SAMN04487965_1307 [Microbulbifer donghaiensis]|uniref:Uncharacterized protein n=1 Tax=Microbulbifer donghaiensis TaxID=494016 RepID=A0A1M4YPB0_9GAMM|nr:hypothetical protein SAMN04487965_1307 [Microbulbifer donghaiensis]
MAAACDQVPSHNWIPFLRAGSRPYRRAYGLVSHLEKSRDRFCRDAPGIVGRWLILIAVLMPARLFCSGNYPRRKKKRLAEKAQRAVCPKHTDAAVWQN